jgi:hypothetical protein
MQRLNNDFYDDCFYLAPDKDFLANRIKMTGSCINKNIVYRCESLSYFDSPVERFVIGKMNFSKKKGDTCRMWVQFSGHEYLYYCWEGFYLGGNIISLNGFLGPGGIVTGEHTTRLVLTEKIRFKF